MRWRAGVRFLPSRRSMSPRPWPALPASQSVPPHTAHGSATVSILHPPAGKAARSQLPASRNESASNRSLPSRSSLLLPLLADESPDLLKLFFAGRLHIQRVHRKLRRRTGEEPLA